MNKCHYCSQPATVRLTDIIKKKKRELHLCEECARQHNLIPEGPTPELNLHALVQLIIGQPAVEAGVVVAGLNCPSCGLQYAAFRTDGRLGCPEDYEAFRPALESLLMRIHRGNSHAGKRPRAALRRAELMELREQLAAAVAAENYEAASVLRDRVRQKEALG
jgi:protein arginine kinase activator